MNDAPVPMPPATIGRAVRNQRRAVLLAGALVVASIWITQAPYQQRRRGKGEECQQTQRDRQRMGEQIPVEGELLVLRR